MQHLVTKTTSLSPKVRITIVSNTDIDVKGGMCVTEHKIGKILNCPKILRNVYTDLVYEMYYTDLHFH